MEFANSAELVVEPKGADERFEFSEKPFQKPRCRPSVRLPREQCGEERERMHFAEAERKSRLVPVEEMSLVTLRRRGSYALRIGHLSHFLRQSQEILQRTGRFAKVPNGRHTHSACPCEDLSKPPRQLSVFRKR